MKQLLKIKWARCHRSQVLAWTLSFIAVSVVIAVLGGTLPVLSQPVNEPICYMQTANGQIVDLTRLCHRNTGNSRVQTSSDRQSVRPVRRGRNATRRSLQSQMNQPLVR